ncbi:MAG TPA: hybrid sensor histidine kinase/response regulator [Chroococcidiopsis sp.]
MNSPSILVVDDQPYNFDVIESLLHNQGYQLHYAASGKEAIDTLKIFQPDLILLDVAMPDMDGIEVCQQIKTMPEWQHVPIIMVTALNTKVDLAHCLEAGADDFISKPVSGLELRARTQSMLRIKQQHDQMQASLKLREEMAAMMVHDLRNPLTSILLGLSTLEHFESSPDERLAIIAQIRLSGQTLQSLIDDLLILSKLESGNLCLNRANCNPSDLINAAIAGFQTMAAQRNIQLIGQLPDWDGHISVDINMFRRVLDNLLANALKFSPRNGQIIVSAEYVDPEIVKIRVSDFGLGVPHELRQKIFEKYEIGTVLQDVSQIGLGLAFCKMVVEAHGGTIGVHDNQPKGAVFEIALSA